MLWFTVTRQGIWRKIESEGNGEYGFATIDIKDKSTLFAGLDNFESMDESWR